MPRMPRRNGYCNRIQAIDELLPCQSKLGPGGVPGFDLGSGGTVKLSAPSRPAASSTAFPQDASFQSANVGRIAGRGLIETEPRFGEVLGKEEPPRGVLVVAERPDVIGAERLEADQQHVGLEPRHEVRLDLGRRIEGADRPALLRLRRRHQHSRIAADQVALDDEHQRRRRPRPGFSPSCSSVSSGAA